MGFGPIFAANSSWISADIVIAINITALQPMTATIGHDNYFT